MFELEVGIPFHILAATTGNAQLPLANATNSMSVVQQVPMTEIFGGQMWERVSIDSWLSITLPAPMPVCTLLIIRRVGIFYAHDVSQAATSVS